MPFTKSEAELDAVPKRRHTVEGTTPRASILRFCISVAPIACALTVAVPLSQAQRPARIPRRTVQVFVSGERVLFDRAQPLNVGRRILVPMRGVFEKMGATVTYDARRRRVLARRGNTNVVLPLGKRTALVNGERRRMDAYPRISRGRVLVPLRFIAETLDATTVYSAPNYTVRIVPR